MGSISENQQNLVPSLTDKSMDMSSKDIKEPLYYKHGSASSLTALSPCTSDSFPASCGLHETMSSNSASPSDWNSSNAFAVPDLSSSVSFDGQCQDGSASLHQNEDDSRNASRDGESVFSHRSQSFLDIADVQSSSSNEKPSDAPLKRIEDFVAKTMTVKSSARRNIRVMKSLKELNPETLRAMEEENARILQMETTEVMLDSPDVEILPIEVPADQQPQPCSSRSLKPPSSYTSDDDDIIDISPAPASVGSNDIIFIKPDSYPSVSSFHCDDAENRPDENGKVLINVSRMKREPCIYVADELTPHLRPHQIGGIRFMWATLVESVAKFSNTPGNGAVLAHSMGLGKTLQVIAFLDAIFRQINITSVLIVAPLNTMAHWMAEFAKWLPLERRPERLKLTCIRDQKAVTRNALIKAWATDGGVLLIGYEKLRAIVDRGNMDKALKRGKKRKAHEAEVNHNVNSGEIAPDSSTSAVNGAAAVKTEPLPVVSGDPSDHEAARLILEAGQIVICDEGHRIKSADAAVTKVLKRVSTRRRMILTGYPLQNNLMEYWCMIDFVRPFLLGSESEFANLFKNPIENGQCKDSTDRDRKIMRQRTYILQRTLCRIVQRRDSRPLIAELPKKREFALIFKQTPSQANLCKNLFEELTKHRDSLNAVALYTTFRNITHHPAIFFAHLNKLSDIATANTADGQPDSSGPICQLLVNLVQQGKWERFLTNLDSFKFDEIHSGKILFLKHLVAEAVVKLKEKIIIFSQSIDVLDYLQEYLPTLLPAVEVDGEDVKKTLRIDGSTSSLERERLINMFNDDLHPTKIFLISTEAGGIGINLTGGCRVVLMDVSWNPSKDIQAISRIYRYGQKNISSIYRLVGAGSMERCVFDRQTHKQFLFKRVIDDKSPTLALNQTDLSSLFNMDKLECNPAKWHQGCDEVFPDEAKADHLLSLLDTNSVFRQYLAEAPKIMDSILEADDTAQLSEYERREADACFNRQKHSGENGGFRRGARQMLPVAGVGSPAQYRIPPETNVPPSWFQHHHAPPGHQASIRAPPPGPYASRAPHPPELVPMDVIIRDPTVEALIKQAIAAKADFSAVVGELLDNYARKHHLHCVRRVMLDRQCQPEFAYSLSCPGMPVNYVFKSDGNVWLMRPSLSHMDSVPAPSLPGPASDAPTTSRITDNSAGGYM